MQATGFLLMLISFIFGFRKISWGGMFSAVTGLPGLLFFLAWLAMMGFMIWFRKHKFRNEDTKSNWTAQIVNAVGQTCLLLGILLAGGLLNYTREAGV